MNSGIWTSYKFSSVEDQTKFIVPLNRDTEHLYYNQRIIWDAKVLTEPRVWKVSKINRTQINGICIGTLVQDKFDYNRDYIEKDELGNIVGQWADYYNKNQYDVESHNYIDPRTLTDYHIVISYTGIKPVIKVRGNYKKFTASFVDKHKHEIEDVYVDDWIIMLDGVDINEIDDIDGNSISIITSNDDDGLTSNQIKIKVYDDSLLGKIITIKAIKGGLESEQNMEIVGI